MKMTKYKENEGPYEALTSGDAALLFIEHQVGLMQLVRDAPPEEFRNKVLGLAKTAKLFELPVILTTSFDWGPSTNYMLCIKSPRNVAVSVTT
jgi:hypothetical protein